AYIDRVLAANEVDVVVPLIIICSYLRGTIPSITNRRVARESHDGQSIGAWISSYLDPWNSELRRKIQSRVPVLRDDEQSGPAEPCRVVRGVREDVSFTDNGLMGRVLRGSADDRPHQRHRQDTRLTDAVAGLA